MHGWNVPTFREGINVHGVLGWKLVFSWSCNLYCVSCGHIDELDRRYWPIHMHPMPCWSLRCCWICHVC